MIKRIFLIAIALAFASQFVPVEAADVTTWSVRIYFKDTSGNAITTITPNQTFYVFADISGTAVSGTGDLTNVYPLAKLNLPADFRISSPIKIQGTVDGATYYPYDEWEVHFYPLEKAGEWYYLATNYVLAEGTNWTTNWSVIAEVEPGTYDLSLSMYDLDTSTADETTALSLPNLYQGWSNRFFKNITVNPSVNISAQTNATLYRRGEINVEDIYGFVIGDTVLINGTLFSGGSALTDPGYYYVSSYSNAYGSLDDFSKMQSADGSFANLSENTSSTLYPITNGNFNGNINGWSTGWTACGGTCTIGYSTATNTTDGTGSINFTNTGDNTVLSTMFATQQFTISSVPSSASLAFAWNKSQSVNDFTPTRHNLSIGLIKPGGTEVIVWFNQSTGLLPQKFKSQVIDISSLIDQTGTYNLTFHADFDIPNTAGARSLLGWFDDVKITLPNPQLSFTSVASIPKLYTNYILQIRANASGSEGFNVSVYDSSAGTWNYRGQINGSTAKQYNYTLTSGEISAGSVQVRMLDNITTGDTVQNSLLIDFVRVYSNQTNVKVDITLLNPKNKIAAEVRDILYSNGFNTTYKLNAVKDFTGVYSADIKATSGGVVIGKERIPFMVGMKTPWVQESTLGTNSTLFRNRKRAPPELYVTCNDCHNKIFTNTSVYYDASKATPAQYTDANQSAHPQRPYPSKNPYWFHLVHAGDGYSPEHNSSRMAPAAGTTGFGTSRTINPGEINHYYEAERTAERAWLREAMSVNSGGDRGAAFYWTGTCSMCHLVTRNPNNAARAILQKPSCTKSGDENACHVVERAGEHAVGPTCEACHGKLSDPPNIPRCEDCHTVPTPTYFNGTTGSVSDYAGNDYTTRAKYIGGSTADVTTDLAQSGEEYLTIMFQPRLREKAAQSLHFNLYMKTTSGTAYIYYLDNRSDYSQAGSTTSTALTWVNSSDLLAATYAPAKDSNGYYVLKINTSETTGIIASVDYAEMNVRAQDKIYRNDTHKGIACLDCHGHAHNASKDLYCTTCKGELLLNTSVHRHDYTATEKDEGVNQSKWCMECHGWQHNASEATSRVDNGSSTPEYIVRAPKCANCHNPQVSNTSWKRYSYLEMPPWGIRVHGNASEKQSLLGKACDFCHLNQHNITKPNCRTPECHGTNETPPSGPNAGPWIRYTHGEGASGAGFQNITCLGCHNNGSLNTVGANSDPAQNKNVILNSSIHLSKRSMITASGSSYNMTPFNLTRGVSAGIDPDGSITDFNLCYKCHDSTIVGSTNCANCHKNDSNNGNLVIHDSTMGVDATINGVMESGGPNCLPCHNETGTQLSRRVNVTAFKLGVHKNVNKNATWYNNVSLGSGTFNAPDDSIVKACWGCHTMNGSQPVNGTMGNIYDNPWKCEDCHANNGSRNASNWTSVNPGSPTPPTVREHIPNQTWWNQQPLLSRFGNIIKPEELVTNVTGNGTCEVCHANDLAVPIQGAYDNQTWRRNVSHYAQNDSLPAPGINTTKCTYCHGNTFAPSPNASKWGGAIYPTAAQWNNSMGKPENASQCWGCHVDSPGVTSSTTFHSSEINPGAGGSPDCISCHDVGGTTPKVNVSAMQRGVHASLNNRTGDPGTSDTSEDSNNRRCWACHSNGSVTETGTMGLNKTSPWRCPDCHTVGGSQRNKYNKTRSGGTSEFLVEEHFKDGSEIQATTSAASNATSCVWCHQNTSTQGEMLLPASEVGDTTEVANADWGSSNSYGPEHRGGNFSFSHYGRRRTDIFGEQEGVNSTFCVYCHQNTTSAFPFAEATRKEIYAHSNNTAQSSVNVNNSNCYLCHNRGRIHQVALTKPTVVAWGGSSAYCAPCHNATASGWSTIPKVYGHNESWGTGPDCTTCHASNTKGTKGEYLMVHNATLERPFDGQSYLCEKCHQNSSDSYNAPKVYAHTNTTLSWVTVKLNSTTNCGKCHMTTGSNTAPGNNLHNSTLTDKPATSQWGGSNSYCAPCHQQGGISAKKVYNHSYGSGSFGKPCAYCHANNTLASADANTLLKPHNVTMVKNSSFTCLACHTNTSGYSFVNASRIVRTHRPDALQANTSLNGWNCENCHNASQPTAKNLNDNRLLHGDQLIINRTWSCNGCHNTSNSRSSPYAPNQTKLWINETWSHNKDGAGRVDPATCAGSCHAINQSYHFASQARGDVNLTLWPGWNNRSANCIDCHVGNHSQSSRPSPFYAPFINGSLALNRTHSTVNVSNVDKCYGCHTNATSTYSAGPVQVHYIGYPDANCLRCHDAQTGSLVGQGMKLVNSTALNLSVHKNINKDMASTGDIGSELNKRCWACHQSNGTQPEYKGDIYNSPLRCYNCHNSSSKPYGNVSNAKNVSEHFFGGQDIRAASNATARQWILGQTDANSSSCLTCHTQSEMLISAGLSGSAGSNANFYHYGANRSAELKVNRTAGRNLFGLSGTQRYTDCAYCHQNTTTAFAGAMSVNVTYHSNMANHTNKSTNNDPPFCTDCHGYGGFHSSNLTVPYKNSTNQWDGMLNSTLCKTCHDQDTPAKSIHAEDRPNAALKCASCHANSNSYGEEKQIHGIRYFVNNASLGFTNAFERNRAANCTTCHQLQNIVSIDSVVIPKIPASFNHSNNESAGGMWNSSAAGFIGLWRPSEGQYLNSCYYCHGNASYVMHNNTALGRVESIRGGDEVNGSIDGSLWCASCHVPNLTAGSDFLRMNSTYGSVFPSVPPGVWNGSANWPNYTAGQRAYVYNHSFITDANKGAQKCKGCHGGKLPSTEQNMTYFVHDVATGVRGSPDCLSCHDAANQNAISSKRVNVTVLNQSVHRNLNSGANSESGVGGLNKTCWACHDSDGANIGESMGDIYTSPYRCFDCHKEIGKPYGNVSNAKNVSEHFLSGTDVQSASNATARQWILGQTDANSSSCLTCHNLDEMLNNPSLGGYGTDANFYHYGANRSAQLKKFRNASLRNLFGYSTANNLSYTNCGYCHDNASTVFAGAMNNSAYHSLMLNHSDNAGSPYCTDCHGYGGFHSSNLTVPYKNSTNQWNGLMNSSLCKACHSQDIPSKDVHGTAAWNSNTLECASCHTNTSRYPETAGTDTKQIHGIRYFDVNRTSFTPPYLRSRAANCTTCHQAGVPLSINGTAAPQIPVVFNHSDNSSAGQIWDAYGNGTNTSKYWGANGTGGNLAACQFCHGNTYHNTTALGYVDSARGSDIVNTTVWSQSNWCASCHYSRDSQKQGVNNTFLSAYGRIPVTNDNSSNLRVGYFNHSSTLSSDYNDSKCAMCHGGNLRTTPSNVSGMDIFMHNVQVGLAGGPNCADSSCHGSGGSGPWVNITALNQSVHKNINKDAPDEGAVTGDHISKRCWACHDSDGEVISNSMGDRKTSPFVCTDCHNATAKPYGRISTALNVTEHFRSGTDIRAGTGNATDVLSCKECHNKNEMIIPNEDTTAGTFDADGDGISGTDINFYHYGVNRSSQLKVSRTPGRNLFGLSGTQRYTDCTYCHQNTSSVFKSAMNVNASYHSDMQNHTNKSTNNDPPFCTDCHGYGGFHSASLIIPAQRTNGTGGMYNSTSLCTVCHSQDTLPKSKHAEDRNATSTLQCADCHANPSAYSNEKQIHGIRYFGQTGSYTNAYEKNRAANCTTCHQDVNIASINNTRIPKIPASFNHSNNESAGGMWNSTAGGFVGYWKPSKGDNLNSCYYCHGNASYVMHNNTALGRVESIRSGNTVNGSIDGSLWCASCHVPNLTAGSDFLRMNSTYGSVFPSVPPGVWNGSANWPNYTAGQRAYVYNHSFITDANKGAQKCKGCHGGKLPSTEQNMTYFVHDVATGVRGSPDCLSCHDAANQNAISSKRVNVTVLNQSVHRNLNSGANSESGVGGLNKTCWACHDSDGANIGESMGDRFDNPYRCYDCHNANSKPYGNVSNAKNVSEHFLSGTDVQSASNATAGQFIVGTTDANSSSCLTCHTQSEMLISANLGGYGTDANFYHYGVNRSSQLKKFRNPTQLNLFGYSTGENRVYTDCTYCHQNTSTAFKGVMNVDSEYHTQMINHTNRSTGPFCTDCHGYGGFHSSNLTVPYKNSTNQWDGMANSSLCKNCHGREAELGGGRINKEEHALNRSIRNTSRGDAERVKCVTCHANTTNYTSPTSGNLEKQIHGIRYFAQSGVFSAPYTKAGAANCTTCHQDTNIAMVGNLTLPKITTSFSHSENESAGYQWINVSKDGVYWNASSDANSQCYYCHAVSNRSAGNKTYILHNATPLGPVAAILDDPAGTGAGNNSINGAISVNSTWCASCHFNNATFYNAVMARFDALSLPRPPSNLNDTLNVFDSKYFNHNGTINDDFGNANYASDSKCKECHGSLASSATAITNFMHRVASGSAGGPNCISCHDLGGSAPKNVNMSAIKLGVHASLNNRSLDPGQSENSYDWNNRRCWACHNNGSVPASGSMGLNKTTPWDCTDCHLTTGSQFGKYDKNGANTTDVIAYEHTLYGDVTTSKDCVFCHNKSTLVSNDPLIPSGKANVSHYGSKDNLKAGSALSSTKDCIGCHKESSGESTKWNAIYLPDRGKSLMGTDQANSCWLCHVDTKGMPSRSFHENALRAPNWRCRNCH